MIELRSFLHKVLKTHGTLWDMREKEVESLTSARSSTDTERVDINTLSNFELARLFAKEMKEAKDIMESLRKEWIGTSSQSLGLSSIAA